MDTPAEVFLAVLSHKGRWAGRVQVSPREAGALLEGGCSSFLSAEPGLGWGTCEGLTPHLMVIRLL